MLKKVLILASVLALVLASAQLALAQQDAQPAQVQATHQDMSGTQGTGGPQTTGDTQTTPPTGASQAAALDPSPRSMIPDAPPAGASQAAGTNHDGLMHLNNNNELVVDCAAVDEALSQLAAINDNLAQPQGTPPPTDLRSQAALTGLKELSQLCADSGFVPASSGRAAPSTPSPTDASPTTQPQDSGSTSGPTGTSSAQPQQNTDTTTLGG
jgi:hypothetical protein